MKQRTVIKFDNDTDKFSLALALKLKLSGGTELDLKLSLNLDIITTRLNSQTFSNGEILGGDGEFSDFVLNPGDRNSAT